VTQLVLSLFPGIGLLDMAFELEGFCVVRGPDVLWGGDVRKFHPPAGRFEGIIGGPPCQAFSTLARLNRAQGKRIADNLIPEFERVVRDAQPQWFVMENVPQAPVPSVENYIVRDATVRDFEVGGKTTRERRFCFGTRDGTPLLVEPVIPFPQKPKRTVTCDSREHSTGNRIRNRPQEVAHGLLPAMGAVLPWAEICERQGLPADFLSDAPFTSGGKRKMLGNGVPLPMGRAIAKAVKESLTPAP
jgi:DNA (cytosine-5)-methyltransferase 1